MPKDISLIGIQPKNVELGLDMTPEIWDKVNDLVERVVSKLNEWNVPCALRSPLK
jgi:Ni,Fe-hydrogenase maturation factor